MTSNHDQILFANSDLTPELLSRMVREGLKGSDYGEFYQEDKRSESITRSMGITNLQLGNGSSGFGFRIGLGDQIGYNYSQNFNQASLANCIKTSRNVLKGYKAHHNHLPTGQITTPLYTQDTSFGTMNVEEKLQKIDEIEAYTYSLDSNIQNVEISYGSSTQIVKIVNANGETMTESRPISVLMIEVSLRGKDKKIETAYDKISVRGTADEVFTLENYQKAAQNALATAKALLIADNAPAGQMDVVLGTGFSGIILHEAVGHGLEGDFNRRSISDYSGKIGKKIANSNVTIIDQGDIPGAHGSLHFDDEGTKTQENILVENGVLKGYMQDRRNALLMGAPLTGNGRRQSYTDAPMPRMTNTYFAEGEHTFEDLIGSTKNGLYIDSFSNG